MPRYMGRPIRVSLLLLIARKNAAEYVMKNIKDMASLGVTEGYKFAAEV